MPDLPQIVIIIAALLVLVGVGGFVRDLHRSRRISDREAAEWEALMKVERAHAGDPCAYCGHARAAHGLLARGRRRGACLIGYPLSQSGNDFTCDCPEYVAYRPEAMRSAAPDADVACNVWPD